MDPERHHRISELFGRAISLSDAERGAFLEGACADDPSLLAEVERLLAHDGGVGATEVVVGAARELRSAAAAFAPDRAERPIPERIGPYRVLGLIGEGGMGTVYEAEQQQPRRVVALKVLRAGVGSEELLKRFQLEAEVLGLLEHRGIARIYDGGTADTGEGPRPYIAMERIDGVPLDRWVLEERPTVTRRVELLVEICDAVQHAHQKGIIHRDLKPANILVDREGQPKVLDFGVARAVDGDVAAVTLRTDVGQLVGTLPYMSPEQLTGDPKRLDTRSDVYALGVVAFEVLSGRLPHDVHGSGLAEAVRAITEAEPPRLRSVAPGIDRDLESVVAMALEKDCERRYASVAGLASDLRRWLDLLPVSARPATTFYQLRKFASRNRGLVAAAAAVFVTLALGVVGTGSGWMRAAERGVALAREADNVRRVHEFLLEDLLRAPDPRKQGKDVRLVDWLERASQRVGAAFRDRPELETEVRGTLGKTYEQLGAFPESEGHLRAAYRLALESFGADDDRALEAESNLAHLLWKAGRNDEAEPLARHAWEVRATRHGAESEAALESENHLGLIVRSLGRLEEAEPLLRHVHEVRLARLGADDRQTLIAEKNVALVVWDQGRMDEAEPLLLDVLARRRTQFGDDDLDTLAAWISVASFQADRGKFEEALHAYRRVASGRLAQLGPRHVDVLEVRAAIAGVHSRLGAGEQSEEEWRQVVAQSRATPGLRPMFLARCLNGWASVLDDLDRFDEAMPLFQESLAIRRRETGDRSRSVATALNNLGVALTKRERVGEAVPLLREAYEIRREQLGLEHPEVLNSLLNVARVMSTTGDPEGALPLLQEGYEVAGRVLAESDLMRAYMEMVLGDCLLRLGRQAEGASFSRAGVERALEHHGADHPWTKSFANMAAEVHAGLDPDAVARFRAIADADSVSGANSVSGD